MKTPNLVCDELNFNQMFIQEIKSDCIWSPAKITIHDADESNK